MSARRKNLAVCVLLACACTKQEQPQAPSTVHEEPAPAAAAPSQPVKAQISLPFAPTPSAGTVGPTIADSKYAPRSAPKHLPDGAPNVLIIMLDDVGPGLPATYGGPIATPTLSRIADSGISFNSFHNAAMCSPT